MASRILLSSIFLLLSSTIYGHDLEEVIRSTTKSIQKIQTYEFDLIKREYANGKDTKYQLLQAKVQVEPLKIYIKFIKPRRLAGREALFVDGNLIVRRGGTRMSDLVLMIDPCSPLAMDGNRYPITHMNPHKICVELVDHIKNELKFDPVIKRRPNSKYNGQIGTHYRLTHNKKQKGMRCKTAEMLISDEHNIPIYFKVVNWANITVEEYAFSNIKINWDFDHDTFNRNNPEYKLREHD